MSLVGYARVSSTDQSLEVQLSQLTEAGCVRIFSERKTATTAHEDKRPELKACMDFLRKGDTLLVTRLDRFSRSATDFYSLMTQLEKKGVSFKALLQPEMDTTTSNGRLIMGLLAIIAEHDNDMRKQRQREGIEKARARGVYQANTTRNGKLAAASRFLNEGASYKEVSERVGVPENTLRGRLPGHQKIRPQKGSLRFKKQQAGQIEPPSPSAAEAVEEQPTPKAPPQRHGLFSSFRRA